MNYGTSYMSKKKRKKEIMKKQFNFLIFFRFLYILKLGRCS